MDISAFFKLVEIRTKVASVIPFFIGIVFTIYRYQTFNTIFTVLFFLSMICIDMATTAINNYMDYKRAIKKDGYNYVEHNAMVSKSINEKNAKITIFILILLASIFGIILFLLTDWIILVIGVISFIIGIFYSYGPLPISRTPFGEFFSGIIMGGIIFFVTVYMHIFNLNLVVVNIYKNILYFKINIMEILIIFFISSPLVFMVSNIMLSNNICDLEDDVLNKRHTLPYYIGRKRAINLFITLYIISYLVITCGVVLKILPITNLFVLLTLFPILKNIKTFSNNQDKATTFVLAVNNFIIISIIWLFSFLIYFIL